MEARRGRGSRRAGRGVARAAGTAAAAAIREAQELLAALGYAPGPADGQWGARTGSAYAAFLRDAGLPPEEALTPEALRAMREIAAGGGGEPAAAARRRRRHYRGTRCTGWRGRATSTG